MVWKETKLRRVAYCGRALQAGCEGVAVKLTGEPGSPDARAGFSGVQSCGSVWACPVCSEKVNAARQAELELAIQRWIDRGGAIVFGTFTVRHHGRHRLAAMLDAIAPAWNRTTSGAGVAWNGGKSERGDKATFGVVGYARLLEVKHGDNGWHPHVHALFFLDRELADAELDQLRHRLFGRWTKALGKDGFSALEFDQKGHAVGVDLRPVKDTTTYLADYFAKNGYRLRGTSARGAAYELTGSQSKRAGKGGRTPFQLLGDLVVAGTGELPDGWTPEQWEADRKLWWEWEAASKGRRQLTWSHGLRKLLKLDREKDDQELVDEDHGGVVQHVFTADEWRDGKLWRMRHELLDWAESGKLRRIFHGHKPPPDRAA